MNAMLVTGFPYDVHDRVEEVVGLFGAFVGRARAVRRLGSAAIDLCYVAAGRMDGFWESDLKPWDIAGGALIVAEAGGSFTDMAGAPSAPNRGLSWHKRLLHERGGVIADFEESESYSCGCRRSSCSCQRQLSAFGYQQFSLRVRRSAPSQIPAVLPPPRLLPLTPSASAIRQVVSSTAGGAVIPYEKWRATARFLAHC